MVWLATSAVFWPTRQFGFLFFDDDINIFLNPHLGRFDRTTIVWILSNFQYMRRYIPAGWAGFSVLYDFFGLDPHGYHLACIFLHGINTSLVVVICHAIIRQFQPEHVSSPRAWSASAIAGAWWGWHPLRVEIVAWASGYLYVQAAFFLLVSFYLYIAQHNKSGVHGLKLALSVAFYIFSILSYPLALAYPVMLIAWEAARAQRDAGLRCRKWWPEFRPVLLKISGWYGVPAVISGVMTLYASGSDPSLWGRPASLQTLGYAGRIGRAVYSWGYYLWKPWWPLRAKLVSNSIHDPAWHEKNFLLCLLSFVAVIYFCFVVKRARHSGFWALGAAYLALLVPVLGLTEKTHFAADRYSYLASLPMAISLALSFVICRGIFWRKAGGLIILIFACGLFPFTRQQLYAWRDSEVFFKTALSQLSPSDDEKSRLYLMRTNMLRLEGDYDQARKICGQGLKEFPGYGPLNEQRQAIERTEAASKNEAHILGLTASVCRLAHVHELIAAQKIKRKEYREAADHLRAALQAAANYYPARFELAAVLTLQGMPDEALSCYLQALAASNGHILNADRAHFLFMLAQASALNGEERLARIAFKKAQNYKEHIPR